MPARTARRMEVPTVAIAVAIYGGWLALTGLSSKLPLWLVAPLGAWLVAWHGSLQHETIHGHPTRWRRVNAALGWAPLSLWLPYGIYREQHIAHHRSNLTDPLDDPESFYVTEARWQRAGVLERAMLRTQMTLVGRLLVGPAWIVGRFLHEELSRLARGDAKHVRAWLLHLTGVAAVVAWLVFVCRMPIATYLACFVYPGVALTLLRSFAEHEPSDDPRRRVAVVESSVFGLLFLNNNLHVIHHDAPELPWYELPLRYRERKVDLLAEGRPSFDGYARIARDFAFRVKSSPVHPTR